MTEPTNEKALGDKTLADNVSPDENFVSQLYQASKQAGPETSIDNAILAMAKKELNLGPASSTKKSTAKESSTKTLAWWKQMQYQGATAASVLIVCLVFLLQPPTDNIALHEPPLAISPALPSPQSDEVVEEAAFADLQEQSMPVQSELVQRERKVIRFKVQADEQATQARAKKSMDSFASTPKPNQSLLAENDVILKKLREIQATLALSHTQITGKAERQDLILSLTNESEENSLVDEYLAQHKKMKDNLSKILADSSDNPDLAILEPYSDVLSVQEVEELKGR
jgi:hypothetical protein